MMAKPNHLFVVDCLVCFEGVCFDIWNLGSIYFGYLTSWCFDRSRDWLVSRPTQGIPTTYPQPKSTTRSVCERLVLSPFPTAQLMVSMLFLVCKVLKLVQSSTPTLLKSVFSVSCVSILLVCYTLHSTDILTHSLHWYAQYTCTEYSCTQNNDRHSIVVHITFIDTAQLYAVHS